ncbi:hypothetical protein CO168_00640, partial [Candidatus Shapirobacteria bacterium CG_4_9_14_3_um_filter_36_12]
MLKKLLLIVLYCFVFSGKVNALMLLDDNFDLMNSSDWNFIDHGGSIISENGVLKLRSSNIQFPIIYSKHSDLFSSQDNVVFETKFMFSNVTPMGDGVSVGFTGLDGYPFYQFSLWNDTTYGLRFVSNNFNTRNFGYCNFDWPYMEKSSGFVTKSLNFANSTWHKFRIEKVGTQFNVYFDKEVNPIP